MSISREQDPVFDAEVPVAIIGAGAAGLIAALACRGAGVEPLAPRSLRKDFFYREAA